MADKDKNKTRERSDDSSDLAETVRNEVTKIFNASNWRSRVQETVETAEKLRRRLRRTEKERDEALEKVPKDGQAVLSKEDAEAIEKFKKDHPTVKLSDLPTIVKEHGDLKTKVAEREEEEQYVEAAEAMDWPNVKAVKRFLKREGLHLEFQDVRTKDDDGKTTTKRTPMVRPKNDDKAKLVALDEYVDEEMPDMIDVFVKEPEERAEDEEGEPERKVSRRRESKAETLGDGIVIAEISGKRGTPNTNAKNDKRLQEIEDAARDSGMYGM
jgi:hypothetical protein